MKVNHVGLAEVDSTNSYAKLLYDELPDGTLVTADCQTAGRGRLDRAWLSPRGNIYASFIMKKVHNPFHATIVASLSVLETLRAFAPDQRFFIKWPNDVYAGHAKISGILSECIFTREQSSFGVISGMGINVNLSPEELRLLDQRATSLFCLEKHEFNLKNVTERLVKSLEKCYILYLNASPRLFKQWKKENALIGKELEFASSTGSIVRAHFADINESGEAVVRNPDGEFVFSCGDVRILKDSI